MIDNTKNTVKSTALRLFGVIFLSLFAFTGSLFAAGDMQAIQFTDSRDPVPSNGRFRYKVKLKNNRPDNATNAILNVIIPEGFTFLNTDNPNCTYNGNTPSDDNTTNTVDCTFATFPGSTELDINISVRAPLVAVPTVFESMAHTTCDSDANTANDTENAKTTVVRGADLNLTKTSSPNPVVAGGIVTYKFEVANSGPHAADAVRLVDTLPAGLVFFADNASPATDDDSAWHCTAVGQNVTCQGGDMANGASAIFYFRAKVSQSSVGGDIVNTARIRSDTKEVRYIDNVDEDTLSLLPGTDMGIQKSITTSPAISDQNLTFELVVTNHGPESAEDVNITDVLPSNYTDVIASAVGWTCDVSGNPVITCTRDTTMPVGTSETITVTAQARHVDAIVVHQNSATVATTTADPISDNDSDTVSYELKPDQADLWLTKSKGPTPLAIGDTATSVLQLGNHGPRPATPVQMLDHLSNNETYVSYDGTDWSCTHTGANGDGTGGTVTCDYSQILAIGATTPTLDILTTATHEGTMTNTACTGGSGGSDEPTALDKNTLNDCVGVGVSSTDPDSIGTADLRVIKMADDSFLDVNENSFSYIINIKNIEGNTSREVEFRDTIPQYVSAFGGRPATALTATADKADANCSITAAVVVCQLGNIVLNEEVNVTITVTRPMADGNRTNTASAYSQTIGDPNRSNNEDNTSVEVAPMADIQLLSKIVTPDDVLAGTEAIYTIQVQNRGPSTARDVNITDVMSGKPFTLISKPNYCDYTEGTTTLQCTLGDMTNGSTRTISMTIRPDHLVPAPIGNWEINNTATVVEGTYDPDPSNNEKNATLLVHEGQVDLIIEKSESPIFHEPVSFDPDNLPHNLLVYQIDIQNLGPSLATDIHFVDRVVSVSPYSDQNLTFVRDTSHPDGSDDGNPSWCVPPVSNPFSPGAAASVIDCNVSELAAGDSLVRYLVFHIENAPHYVFGDVYKDEINITSREIEVLSGNNEEDEKTTVRVQTDVQMSKTAPMAPVEVGEHFTYLLTVTNHGPGYSPSTDITDSLPVGMVLTGTPTASPQGSCTGTIGDTSFTCNVDGSDGTLHSKYLDASQLNEVNITVPVMMTVWTGDTVTNTASVSTSGPDSNESNNLDSADITVFEPAHIGNRVWHDLDADGIQDAGESGIANVTVELLYDSNGSVALTTVTNASGIYNFDINHSTDYRVHIDLSDAQLNNYRITTENNLSTTDFLDSDINASGETGADLIAYGETNTTFDAGFFKVASIGDRVWIDDNGDGQLNVGEVGVPDVNVTLYDSNNNQVITDIDGVTFGMGGILTTDASGHYLFENLRPGIYHIVFDKTTLPAEYVFTHVGAGGANADNSDPDRVTGVTTNTILISDEHDMHWDAGIYIPVSIGDYAWHDIDGNGIQDVGEPGLNGIEVKLYNSTCSTVISQDQNGSAAFAGTVHTDASGAYLFDNLAPRTYCVGFQAPLGSGYVLTQTNQGLDDSDDSDAFGTGLATGNTGINSYVLTSGEDNVSADAGYYIEIKVGDRVWEDLNYNGIQDAGEDNVSGVRVHLVVDGVLQDGTGGTTNRFKDTNSSGEYLFDDLVPGYRYSVRFSNLPAEYRFTQQDVAGATDETDSDANITGYASGETPIVVSQDVNLSFDAGVYKPVVIGDRVWEDMDADGLQDAGEPGIQGVTVTLVIDNVVQVGITDTTDGSGDYLFDTSYDLKPDHTYSVQFSNLPASARAYNITTQDVGSDDTSDSDIMALNMPVQATPTLYSDEENLTLDAGFYRNASMGNRIWLDTNGNGIQDMGELGVSGVTVRLYDTSNTLQDTNITDTNGLYHFDDLRPGNYYVVVDQATLPMGGYVFTQKDAGGNNDIDSDVNGTGVSTVVVLTSNEDDNSTDAGIYIPVSIGDHAWVDEDGDGLQDIGEQNLSGVGVQLYRTVDNTEVTTDLNGTVFGAVTTDVNGAYLFDNLRPDDYYVRFTAPNASNYVITLQSQGADGSIDSDPNGVATTTGITASYTLSSDEDNMSVDAGFYEPIEIGDRVWIDRDYNGIQDAGEQNLSGVDVTLYQDGTIYGAPMVTNANGAYLFDALPQGHIYSVEFNLSNVNTNNGTDYRFTQQDQGNDATDSDADMVTGKTISTAFMRSGDSDMTLDTGAYEPVTIGDKVWLDNNGDGIQDAAEIGLAGVLVTLIIDGVEHTEINATTNATGDYLFDHSYDLKPDHTYSVHFSNPDASYIFTQANAGNSDSNDSDANATGYSTEVTPMMYTGERNLTLDAGMNQLASIGNRIWLDSNADGIQDVTEQNLAGVSVDVALFAEDGTQVGVTQTVANGSYLFTGVVPGNYYVTFSLPAGYNISPDGVGIESLDSDVNASLRTATTLLTSGENDVDWDMGVYQSASLGDRIWLDTDADGIQDATEQNLNGVDINITLYDSANQQVGSMVSTNNGTYSFTGLVPGDYYVTFTLPNGYVVSPQDATSEMLDSDVDSGTLRTATTTLISGENDTTWDMGIYQEASIGDRIWLDTNADGMQDTTELNVTTSVTVTLLDDTNSTVATQTVANGSYLFTGVTPGTYHVRFSLPAGYVVSPLDVVGSDDQNDSDVNATNMETIPTVLISGENEAEWDLGLYQPASIGDLIWLDTNGDGVQNNGEGGFTGSVTVYLEDENNATVIDASGNTVLPITTNTGSYLFSDLVPGTYHIRYGFPASAQISPLHTGTTTTDSDVIADSNTTDNTILISGENDTSWDAGLFMYAGLGDLVWIDTNGNGLQDDAQILNTNVIVNLYYDGNGSLAGTQTVMSGSNGLYNFANVDPNDYYVEFVLPVGSAYKFITPNAGSDDTTDSDVDVNTGRTPTETIVSEEFNNTLDAGIYIPASIGDHVWFDANANGFQDTNEGNISDINVTLYDSHGAIVATVTTDENGSYLFDGLVPGDYTVGMSLTDNHGQTYVSTAQVGVQADSNNSDVNAAGVSATISIVSGQDQHDIDAGMYIPVDIGNFVWSDQDGDGVQDAGEPGISDINVTLYRVESDGTITTIGSQSTTGTGGYLFASLVPGEYYIHVDQPNHFRTTIQDAGVDDSVDSDIDTASGESARFMLRSPDDNLSLDAGFYALATISGQVLEDTDNDDSGDTNLSGVTITLFNDQGHQVQQVVTDANGNYSFIDVEPDNYTVVETQPTDMVNVSENEGGADNDTGNTTLDNIIAVTVGIGEVDVSNDFVDELGVFIGNRIWMDTNGDGVQDTTENNDTVLEDISVNLYRDGIYIATTTTDAQGYYLFGNYPDGNYSVEFNLTTLPAHYGTTMQDQGSDDTNDSDVNETTYATIGNEAAMSPEILLLPGDHNMTVDMGIYRLGTVSGTVRVDMDGDNDTHGANDDVMVGVQIDLVDENGQVVATVYTDSNGQYHFIDVPQGTYTIREHQPDGYLDLNATSGDVENSDVNEITVVVGAAEDDTQNDFDDKLGGKIGNFVWNDTDAEHGANGIQDANESGVNGVHVCLEDEQGNAIIDAMSGEPRCTDTNATGYYEFVGLIPGSYLVVFEIPDGTDLTPVPLAGDNRMLDSNPIETMEINGMVVAKAPIEVGIGVQDESIDMGLVYEETASIGDYIWNDRNYDGIQDPDEVGIDGIHVILYDANGTRIEEYITHSGGYYRFEHLQEGHYIIQVIVTDDWTYTGADVENDDADSDANPLTGKTIEIDLQTGQHQGIWDIGLYCPCSNIVGDSADTMSRLGLLFLMLMIGGVGLFSTRRYI